uniref:Uncharacterized protein n=1 Tax=Chromera velia CCMP2878 TaxID=1169474 RepID=A0A0G4HWG5_9ALVE|eukprot:Cvel_32695.t1-p1 / transcript=Cvel_32695.t1 / gene=Cvel_32695 / organism=Chromera_velia_CCMP2878 / gene_product=Choline dehydrogenase, putative / transcript_product=Choline dehydrogenase, putative / location=Cvel_scaffold5142:290-978(-) / protein_length=114 / sequence_SO=supercontig / SO=protein_coding / is_pseudo=false
MILRCLVLAWAFLLGSAAGGPSGLMRTAQKLQRRFQDELKSRFPLVSKDASKAEYDYIIVGGGTAGCVLANRLSSMLEKEGRGGKILVLEAGDSEYKSKLLVRIPANILKVRPS